MSERRTRMVSIEAVFFFLSFFHTREGTVVKGKDAIHFVLVSCHLMNLSF